MQVNGEVYRKNFTVGFAVALTAICVFGVIVASGVLVTQQSFTTTGILATANLGLYTDSACTQGLVSVDWGTITPGSSVSRTIYVKNLGSTQVTLSFSISNWIPAAANGPVAFSWNREGATLGAGQVTSATITLSVSSGASGFTIFNANAMITGTG
jgi:hypothetical protein